MGWVPFQLLYLGPFSNVRCTYDDELATVTREEACKIFNRSYSTLLRWEKDGYLVPVKIGKTPLYKMSDIKDVLNQKFGNS